MLTERKNLVSFVLDGHLYAAGGNVPAVSSVERYDAEVDHWSPVAAMAMRRCQPGASVAVVGEAGDGGDMDLFESLISRAILKRARS